MSIAKRLIVIIALVAIVVSLGLIDGGAVGRADDEPQPLEAVPLGAGAPLLISYQGRLEDPATGNPKPDGTYGMTFRLFDVASGGTPLWTEYQTVPLTNGLFNVYLGSVEPLSASLFGGTLRYLQLEVGGIVLSPRQRLTAVPYAIQATEAMTATNADTVDGQHAAAFATTGHGHDAAYVNVTGDSMSGPLTVTGNAPTYVITATNSDSSVWGSGGIYGEGNRSGVHGRSSNIGVWGHATSSGGAGVIGDGGNQGVYGSGSGYGVFGQGGAMGVYGNGGYAGLSGSGGSTGYGADLFNMAATTPTLRMWNSLGGPLIQAYGSDYYDVEFKVAGNGNVSADGSYTTPASDMAELMAVEGDASAYAPGDVLCVSQSSDNTVVRCAEAGSTAVIGVYSTKPGFVGGSPIDGDTAKIPVAITGIVPVKASAESGAIRRGDLLTTASVAGHAMKATSPLPGTVLGKALSPLESGTGTISVMITLR